MFNQGDFTMTWSQHAGCMSIVIRKIRLSVKVALVIAMLICCPSCMSVKPWYLPKRWFYHLSIFHHLVINFGS